MTTQVAVFNQQCVAVASDSCLTVGTASRYRTFDSSEKIHDLGPEHAVVIMNNGEARFMGVPYAVLVPAWASTLESPLPCITDYLPAFMDWLEANDRLFTPAAQVDAFLDRLHAATRIVAEEIERELAEEELDELPWDDLSVRSVVRDTIARAEAEMRELPACDDPDRVPVDEEFLAAQAEAIDECVIAAMSAPRTIEGDAWLRRELPRLLLTRMNGHPLDSTVVAVGYGSDDLFPSSQRARLRFVAAGQMRGVLEESEPIDAQSSARIQPFAQAEAMHTFVRAYHHRFLDIATEAIEDAYAAVEPLASDPDALDELARRRHEAVDDVAERFERFSHREFIAPLIDAVAAMPPAEVARIAEELVGLQLLRSLAHREQPSVGGPIDVALIDRAHGVRWVRRKAVVPA